MSLAPAITILCFSPPCTVLPSVLSHWSVPVKYVSQEGRVHLLPTKCLGLPIPQRTAKDSGGPEKWYPSPPAHFPDPSNQAPSLHWVYKREGHPTWAEISLQCPDQLGAILTGEGLEKNQVVPSQRQQLPLAEQNLLGAYLLSYLWGQAHICLACHSALSDVFPPRLGLIYLLILFMTVLASCPKFLSGPSFCLPGLAHTWTLWVRGSDSTAVVCSSQGMSKLRPHILKRKPKVSMHIRRPNQSQQHNGK